MGLDMFLTRRIWVGAAEREHMHLTGLGDLVDPTRVCAIVEDIGSWRKANAIHRWFVTNAQDGQDDCRPAEVSRDQLRALLRSVITVLAQPERAPDLLPTQGGFYFGATDYGAGYLDDLRETQHILLQALATEGGTFAYSASW